MYRITFPERLFSIINTSETIFTSGTELISKLSEMKNLRNVNAARINNTKFKKSSNVNLKLKLFSF